MYIAQRQIERSQLVDLPNAPSHSDSLLKKERQLNVLGQISSSLEQKALGSFQGWQETVPITTAEIQKRCSLLLLKHCLYPR